MDRLTFSEPKNYSTSYPVYWEEWGAGDEVCTVSGEAVPDLEGVPNTKHAQENFRHYAAQFRQSPTENISQT